MTLYHPLNCTGSRWCNSREKWNTHHCAFTTIWHYYLLWMLTSAARPLIEDGLMAQMTWSGFLECLTSECMARSWTTILVLKQTNKKQISYKKEAQLQQFILQCGSITRNKLELRRCNIIPILRNRTGRVGLAVLQNGKSSIYISWIAM